MLTYFIITAAINILISHWLLNCRQVQGAVEYSKENGKLEFYIVSAMLGCAMVPIYIGLIFYVLFIENRGN